MTVHLKTVGLPNGETLGYRVREGGNKTLLLIHGNMTSSKHWDLLIDALPNEYRIIALDLRGFGLSTYKQPIESIKDFSDDMKLFVDALSLKDFTAVGWSLGGTVAMQFIAENPGYASKLVLVASGSTRGFPAYGLNAEGNIDLTNRLKTKDDFRMDAVRTIPIQAAYDNRDANLLKAVWNSVIYDKNQPSSEKYEEYIDDMCTQQNYADVLYALNRFNISKHHNGVIEGNHLVNNLNLPILALFGDRELVITKQMQEELLSDLPKQYVTYVELKDCGHSPLVDDINQLVEAITVFLEKKVEEKQ
ncbi:alpha/beta fold hydrolase [Bacillus salitolerans]|uniref:Alpha/beta fold hydrolase n=1 Tax=Bacillus salitolerans TaxID=1437434 RepID=A0ABW4LVP8_9BACI